jgi:hypothetical protein
MKRAILILALAITLLEAPGIKGQPEERGGSSADKIVAVLQTAKVSYEKDLQTTPFKEMLEDMAKRYNITFVINKSAIGDMANTLDNAKPERLSETSLNGMLLGTFFDVYFRGLAIENLTYLVRSDHIEITTREAAQKEAGILEAIDEAKATGNPAETVRAKARLNLPLICVVAKERPLLAVFNDLSGVYGLNIVVEPGAREALKNPFTERLLNVPADTALELLAAQADLKVVRKGNTFRITSVPRS